MLEKKSNFLIIVVNYNVRISRRFYKLEDICVCRGKLSVQKERIAIIRKNEIFTNK